MDHVTVRRKLTQCFSEVLGAQLKGPVTEASMDNTPSWDSVETWRLAMSVEEAFKTKINLERFAALDSFVAFETYLLDRLG